MDVLTQLLVLCVVGGARAEPLGSALRRYSNYGVYAGDYSRDYEPYVYAAIPLHAPVPVLRILSPAPLGGRDTQRVPSVHHPAYARAPYDLEYGAHDYEPAYEAPPPQYAAHYQPAQLHAAASSAPEEPTILYARPTAHGGYTYHSAPHKPAAAKRAPAQPDAPYIIRVHKYRIVKER